VIPKVAAQAENALFEVTSSSGTQTIELFAASSKFEESGPTGEEEFPLGTSSDNWRACTIALRAVEHQIPTLSEWGLGVFAALFGIAAAWALRRRAARYNGSDFTYTII
jgi:hypothetical protein